MSYRTFEVHYCAEQRQNISVEVTNRKDGLPLSKKCLYQEEHCPKCPYSPLQMQK